MTDLVSASEACRLLGVKRETLYAYASRGLVRSYAKRGTRQRLYSRDDVARLGARSQARRGHAAVASSAMRWGEPVLDSAITAITPSGPSYRGQLATQLAKTRTFEEVITLLAPGDASEELVAAAPIVPRGASAFDALLFTVASRCVGSDQLFAITPQRAHARALSLFPFLAASLALPRGARHFERAMRQGSIAERVTFALGPSLSHAPLVSSALVLCADHELNTSSFAARVAASAGSSLERCLLAALATLSGSAHGGETERVASLLDEIETRKSAAVVVRERLARGERVPGFGHLLYPAGDPRCPPLYEAAKRVGRRGSLAALRALVRAMKTHAAPTVDVGLVAVERALSLRRGSALALFAVGRMAGFVAHVVEQVDAGHLLRPRARYVGPA